MGDMGVFFMGVIGVFLVVQVLRSPSYLTFLVAVMAAFGLLAVVAMVVT